MLSVLLILVMTFIGINLYLDFLLNKTNQTETIDADDADIDETIKELGAKANVVNIALFGVDNDGNQSDEDRSDAIKIVSLNFDDKTIKITSVERDVVVFIPGDYQDYGHFNWAYWYGGASLAIKTLNYNLDMDITQYVSFSFQALQEIVDLLDGVEIDLTKAELNRIGISGSAGSYKLTGKQALAYCRIRKIDDDYHRMDRQQRVIQAIVDKASQMSYTRLLGLLEEILPYITTNLTTSEMRTYIYDLLDFNMDIATYKLPSGGYDDTVNCPGLGGYLVQSYQAMAQELHDFIYGAGFYQPSQTLIDNEMAIYSKYEIYPE